MSGMILTGGMSLTGGMNFINSGGGSGSWATLNPATKGTLLSLTGNQLSINEPNTSSPGSFCITDGIKTLTSTQIDVSYEVVLDVISNSNPYFYMGVVAVNTYDANTWGSFGTNWANGFGIGPGNVNGPRLWQFDYSKAQAFFSPDIFVSQGDVLGIAFRMTNSGMRSDFYKNGTIIASDAFFAPGAPNQSIFLGWRFTQGLFQVTLKTDPSTFTYGGSYSNQNGWPT